MCARLRADGSERGWEVGWFSGVVVFELLLLRCQYESVQLLRDLGQGSPRTRLLLPAPVPLAVCLSFLPFLPVTFSTESHAPGTSLCPWLAALRRRDVPPLDVTPALLSYRPEQSCLQELEFSTRHHISHCYFCVKSSQLKQAKERKLLNIHQPTFRILQLCTFCDG